MDPISNPFSPGAGAPPPELVGRDQLIEEARILLGRVKQGRPEKSLLLTGLRGVGKTVLLNEIERMARTSGYQTVLLEAHEEKPLGELIYPALRSLLFELDRLAGAGDKVKRGLAVLRAFIGSIKLTVGDVGLGLDIEPAQGTADSGDIEIDLPNLFQAIGEAAQERQTAVSILIDEIQYVSSKELGAIIMAMHRMQQKRLPLVLLAAGLPVLPGMAGESKSYAERLFNFPDIGALSETDAARALRDPASSMGVEFQDEALREVFSLTHGYPYFVQEWGYQTWNHAAASPITLEVVRQATPKVIARLDRNFFRVRFDRLTPSEKSFLRAMAYLGPGSHRTGDIAASLGAAVSSIGPVRAKLIKKGMIYSPAHGDLAFTVPLFDEFMRRAIPDFMPGKQLTK
ncbi:ATP-binding protein [Thauera propionica]|uniref:ATP-binding protein n=1 Tax=Thauera propionica TaxID=2019431 RepID=UPI0023EFB0EA|nr:ATP-binding protein [Thauera propionica]MDD3674067.1 ATP-binding protein [Thauera propionica]